MMGENCSAIRTHEKFLACSCAAAPKRARNRNELHAFSPTLYRLRNRIKRFFNKIKHFRRITTRYEKLAANYLAMIQLASTRIWLRDYESTT